MERASRKRANLLFTCDLLYPNSLPGDWTTVRRSFAGEEKKKKFDAPGNLKQ
jgi:hypothetical protein